MITRRARSLKSKREPARTLLGSSPFTVISIHKHFLLVLVGAAFVTQAVVAMRWLTRNHHQEPILLQQHSQPNRSPRLSDSILTETHPPVDESSVRIVRQQQLPEWIQHYVAWHGEMRAKFPGASLFTDPAAPKLLIRTCLGLCGGLNDRLGQLPWDLYLANQTARVLLLHWHRPVPLEHFLLPNILDWSVPATNVPGFFPRRKAEVRVSREGMKVVRAYKELFQDLGDETHPDAEFWAMHVDAAIQRAVTGSFKTVKVLRHRILGHVNEAALEQRLLLAGETDMLHWTPSFGNIFWMFFRPAPGVQSVLDSVYAGLNLRPGRYSGVHCRVRHPKAAPRQMDMKGKYGNTTADKTGLPWEGETRMYAVQVATRALQCAKTSFHDSDANEPIYFFSDSNDLVRFMAKELTDTTFVKSNASLFSSSPVDALALEAVQGTTVVARDMSAENTHIDKQKNRDAPAYYMTFVDLLLAVNARCLAYGVGYYAVFATKISGTSCKLLYQEEHWGALESKREKAPQCVLPSDSK
jgi:hypothetical protein